MTMAKDQDWMLTEVVSVPYVRHAVVLSSDGLVTARSEGTGKDVADRLAAACSGLQSLGRSVGMEFGSNSRALRHLMIQFDGGFLFVRRAATGSHLAVVTESTVDPALIAQQMQAQVQKIGERALASEVRQDIRT
ncbi:roadblock/LC7 domain-containing protein [Micromonospora sp. NPDC049559]|uniref:roadblock/LC7 domain-containing protein n=1 Tax=Micromonospora sp. NPDC049559 TaxID=3155923 RepID=UPI00343C968E